jgi:hypothetical protein
MSGAEKRTPGGNRASAGNTNEASVLRGAQKTGNNKNGHNRYVRFFPAELTFAAEMLSDREMVAWLRLTLAYVVRDGVLPDDDGHLSVITKTGKQWPTLREKLLTFGLGRIEAGQWIDDHQRSSLDLQRGQSLRGSKGAAVRWGGRDAT